MSEDQNDLKCIHYNPLNDECVSCNSQDDITDCYCCTHDDRAYDPDNGEHFEEDLEDI